MSRYNKKEAQKRLKEAEPWLLESNEAPMHILRKYRKQFHLNNTTAVRDLKAFGIRFTTEQLNALHAGKNMVSELQRNMILMKHLLTLPVIQAGDFLMG